MAAVARLRFNNVYGSLGATQFVGDTTITFAVPLTYNDGQSLPTIVAPDTFDITVEPTSGNFEVQRITAYTSGALSATVTRAIFGAAKQHNAPAGFIGAPNTTDFAGAAPSLTLGTSNVVGSGQARVDADATIAIFDATNPTTLAFGQSPAVGAAAFAARRDHGHGMPAAEVTWPLAASVDQTFQPNSVANSALDLHNNASAVNGLKLTGTATGVAPVIAAVGTDTNIGLEIDTKGTGALLINGAAGAAGQFLQSNGAGAAPTWGTAAGVSWPLTNNADETFRPNSVANSALTLQNVAAATLGVTIIGNSSAAAGGTIVATGAANTRLVLASSGTSDVLIANGGGVGGSNQPTLSIGGSNAQLAADASGFLVLKSGGNLAVRANGTTTDIVAFSLLNGTTNGLYFQTSASGTGAQILSTGGDANVDLRLAMTGAGVLDIRYATTALGGGAAPTLGTIGGSGPATAAQNSWFAIKINGTTSFLPVWR